MRLVWVSLVLLVSGCASTKKVSIRAEASGTNCLPSVLWSVGPRPGQPATSWGDEKSVVVPFEKTVTVPPKTGLTLIVTGSSACTKVECQVFEDGKRLVREDGATQAKCTVRYD